MMRDIFSHKDDLDRIQIVLITNGIVVQRKEKVRRRLLKHIGSLMMYGISSASGGSVLAAQVMNP